MTSSLMCRLLQPEKGDMGGIEDRAERNAGGGMALTCDIHKLLRVWVGYRLKRGLEPAHIKADKYQPILEDE